MLTPRKTTREKLASRGLGGEALNTYLEGYYGEGHHGGPNHGQGVLPPKETRVEETDTGNHDPDESGGGEDPGDVSRVVDGGGASIGVIPLEGSRCREERKTTVRKGAHDMGRK